MSGRARRTLTVLSKKNITPCMIRIVLGGEELVNFPEGQESGYIKLHFFPNGEDANSQKPLVRSYTIRAFDPQLKELTLDFVAHGESGPASTWALHVQVGDQITTDGPGAVKLVDMSADWFFIAGDMTALPAMSVNLEKLPENAKGYAVIEVLSEEDKQHLITPSEIAIHWVINPHPDKENTCLIDTVKTLAWLEGEPNIWVASEFEGMRNLRRYFKQEKQVERGQLYASSYWKMGETDEGNKAAKKSDAEAD
jgi:NADPH-dependent ferric siderophore reductase